MEEGTPWDFLLIRLQLLIIEYRVEVICLCVYVCLDVVRCPSHAVWKQIHI